MDMTLAAVITVCGHAHETCPYFPPRCKVIHVGFDDPPQMARALAEQGADEQQQLDCYRKVRDEIKALARDDSTLIAPGILLSYQGPVEY